MTHPHPRSRRDRLGEAAAMLFGGLGIAGLAGPLLWAAFR